MKENIFFKLLVVFPLKLKKAYDYRILDRYWIHCLFAEDPRSTVHEPRVNFVFNKTMDKDTWHIIIDTLTIENIEKLPLA